jgi:hypothetical protein
MTVGHTDEYRGSVATVKPLVVLIGGGMETGNGKSRLVTRCIKPQSKQDEFRIRHPIKLCKHILKETATNSFHIPIHYLQITLPFGLT